MKNIKKEGNSFTLKDIRAIVIVAAYVVAFTIGAVAPFVTHAAGASIVTVDTINGQLSGLHCVAGDIVITGHGTTGGSGGPYNLDIGWGDSSTSTINSIATGLTSGTMTGGNQSFAFSKSHHFTATSTGITIFLHHSTASGNDSFVIALNQCIVPPTKGLVTVKKTVVNDNGGLATPSSFSLSINGNSFAGSSVGSDFQLFPGTYPITEASVAGYHQSSLVCTGDDNSNTTNGSVTIVAGHNYTCTVTNDDNTPPANSAPIASNQSISVNQDSSVNGTLSATDADSNPLTYAVVAGPSHGSISNFAASTGAFTYTPAAGFVGSDLFTFKANDSHVDSNVATVSITVNHVNHAPVANDDTYNTNEDTGFTQLAPGVISNDTDDDSDPLTATLVTGPSHATSFNLNADGSFDYTPESNYNGVDTFYYTVSDGTLTSNTARVDIVVSNVNDAPISNADNYSTGEDTTLNVAATGILSNDSDADANAITVNLPIESDVNDGSLTVNADGSFSYTPDANFCGIDSFTYKANDGSLLSSTANVVITVNCVNDAPVANDGSVSTNSNTPVNGSASATDADGNTLSFVLGTTTSNGSLIFNTDGTFTFSPTNGFVGSDFFTFKANDGTVDSNMATTTITVNPVLGCTNSSASNFNANATQDDGSCIIPTPTPTPTPTPSGGGNGGGGGGSNGPIAGSLGGGGGNGPIAGSVLGASTTTLPELPAGCSALLHTYMRMGKKNDTAEVKKLQQFLNDELQAGLPINGIFGKQTDSAVREFQKAHVPQVLTPWGITDPTGYVYKTTQRWINLTVCASLNIPMPVLN